MNKFILFLSLSLSFALPAHAQQNSTAEQIVIGTNVASSTGSKWLPTGTTAPLPVSVYGGTATQCYTSNGPGQPATFQACGGGSGGSGTVNIGSTGQVAAYLANGTAVSPTNNIDLNNGGVTVGTNAVGNAPGLNGIYASGPISTGSPAHASQLNVSGGVSIGTDYVIVASPTNGAIIEGSVGIGTTSPSQLLGVGATNQFTVSSAGAVTGVSFSGLGTGLTGTAAGLTAGNVTTNANLTGPITSVGNATSIAAQTGTGTTFVVNTAPTIQTSLNITPASGGLLLGGANGISYPSVDSTTDGTIAIGSQAFANPSTSAAYNSVAIGEQTLFGTLTTAAIKNTAVGFQAGVANTSSHDSTYIGYRAGAATTSGISNTFVGSACDSVNVASSVTCMGAAAKANGNNSVAIGAGAIEISGANNGTIVGSLAQGGGNSVIVGENAGTSAMTGTGNTTVGFLSGHTITSGANNTILGQSVATSTLTTGSNNILIGTDSSVTSQAAASQNTLNIGNLIYGTSIGTAASPGNIGIGSASPQVSLDVVGTIRTNNFTVWPVQPIVSASATTSTSTVALANVTGLTANLLAGKTYTFEAHLFTTATVVGGVQFDLGGGTATVTNLQADATLTNSTTISAVTRTNALTTVLCSNASATVGTCTIFGTIVTNAAGTLIPRFAQNTSNGAASTVLTGSYMILTQTN